MPVSTKEYFTKVFTDAGIDQAEIDKALVLFDHEKVKPAVETILDRSENFEAMQGRMKNVSDREKANKDWFDKNSAQWDKEVKEVEELKTLLKAQLGNEEVVKTATSITTEPTKEIPVSDNTQVKYLSVEEHNKALQDARAQHAELTKSIHKLNSQHRKSFGDDLDIDLLEAEVIKKQAEGKPVTLESAYENITAEARKANEAKELQRKIDEGVAEVLKARGSLTVPGLTKQDVWTSPVAKATLGRDKIANAGDGSIENFAAIYAEEMSK